MTQQMLINWSDIIQTREFIQDKAFCAARIYSALAGRVFLDDDDAFVEAGAYLLAIYRYKIKHMPELQDIDQSSFFPLIMQEVGLNIPITTLFPVNEWLRENKHWYGSKGTKQLYQFLGDLIGSPINIFFPRDLLFALDNPNTVLDGAASTSGPLAFGQSKMGRIRGGAFWARYTYQINVMNGEAVSDLAELTEIIKSIHPAGTKYFLNIISSFLEPTDFYENLIFGTWQVNTTYFYVYKPYPGLDNGFRLDDVNSTLDMLGGTYLDSATWIKAYRGNCTWPFYRTLADDNFMHVYPAGKPGGVYYKWQIVGNTYQILYPDQDPETLLLQQTNMSAGNLSIDEAGPMDMRIVQNIAMSQEGMNPPNQFCPLLPLCTIVAS